MFSFYSLPSSVLKHEKHTKLHAAYCYYYFAFASFATRALRQRGARSTPGGGRSSLSSWMCGPSSPVVSVLCNTISLGRYGCDGESGTLTTQTGLTVAFLFCSCRV